MTAAAHSRPNRPGHALHLGVAEAGKLKAIAGDHVEALRHYREALRLAAATGAPEVFFRHYTQCVLESLEQTGSHAEVIDFCRNALAHYDALESPLALHRRDHAATLERYAINLVKAGHAAEARAPLEKAVALTKPGDLPIARTVLDWMTRGMQITPRRVLELQEKHGYFCVSADCVEPSRAIPLPEAARATGPP